MNRSLLIEDFDAKVDNVSLAVRCIRTNTETDLAPIVFLHDSWGCIDLWRHFPKSLGEATGRDAIVYDRQGYGRSQTFSKTREVSYLEEEGTTLIHLLDSLEIERAVLFGHSDGGSIALVAAAERPERIEAVITEGAHVFVEDITIEGIREGVRLFKETDLRQKLSKYHSDKTDAMFSAWCDTWLKPEFRQWNIEKYLPKIVCPVLVIQGETDEYGTLDQVDAIVRQVNGTAQKFIIPGVGHTPHRDAPSAVLERCVQFLSSISD